MLFSYEMRETEKERRKLEFHKFKDRLIARRQKMLPIKNISDQLKRLGEKYSHVSMTADTLETRLLCFVNTNNIEATHHLLKIGVDPNTRDLQKRFALHIAVAKDYRDIVKLLLRYGADPNTQDAIGNTPLHLAACSNRISTVSLLINAGANVNLIDMHGRHPLQLAKSRLELLRKNWMHGEEMGTFEGEVQEIIDLMKSVTNANERAEAAINAGGLNQVINSLENMKLSINTDDRKNMEGQMTQLLDGFQNFQLQ